MKRTLGKWGLLGAATYGVLRLARPWFNNWGATDLEKSMPVPGEELLNQPKINATHAITIDAPPREVWSWLIQMGVGRGGFYSYSWLENLVGCGVHNISEIKPELQNLKQGDTITLHPKAPPLRVTLLEEPRVLALEGWIFYLQPIGASQTRLIVRGSSEQLAENASTGKKWIDRMVRTVFFDFAHFIMERKQMLRVKELAERHYRQTPGKPLALQPHRDHAMT